MIQYSFILQDTGGVQRASEGTPVERLSGAVYFKMWLLGGEERLVRLIAVDMREASVGVERWTGG